MHSDICCYGFDIIGLDVGRGVLSKVVIGVGGIFGSGSGLIDMLILGL